MADTPKHKCDKAAAGTTYDVQKGVYIIRWQEVKCSVCGKARGRRKIEQWQSPLRARMGGKAGKMIWPPKGKDKEK